MTEIMILLAAVVLIILVVGFFAIKFLRADANDPFEDAPDDHRRPRDADDRDWRGADRVAPPARRSGRGDRGPGRPTDDGPAQRPGRSASGRGGRRSGREYDQDDREYAGGREYADDRSSRFDDRDPSDPSARGGQRLPGGGSRGGPSSGGHSSSGSRPDQGRPAGRPGAASARTGGARGAGGSGGTDWDSLSDVDYWAELASDKPLTTTAQPAGPSRTERGGPAAQSDPRQDPTSRPGRPVDSGPPEDSTALLPVRRRNAPAGAADSAPLPAVASGRGGAGGGLLDGGPRSRGGRSAAPGQSGSAGQSSRRQRDQSAAPYSDSRGLLANGPAAAGPLAHGTDQGIAALARLSTGGGRPAPLEDDPLTSPSFPAAHGPPATAPRTRSPRSSHSRSSHSRSSHSRSSRSRPSRWRRSRCRRTWPSPRIRSPATATDGPPRLPAAGRAATVSPITGGLATASPITGRLVAGSLATVRVTGRAVTGSPRTGTAATGRLTGRAAATGSRRPGQRTTRVPTPTGRRRRHLRLPLPATATTPSSHRSRRPATRTAVTSPRRPRVTRRRPPLRASRAATPGTAATWLARTPGNTASRRAVTWRRRLSTRHPYLRHRSTRCLSTRHPPTRHPRTPRPRTPLPRWPRPSRHRPGTADPGMTRPGPAATPIRRRCIRHRPTGSRPPEGMASPRAGAIRATLTASRTTRRPTTTAVRMASRRTPPRAHTISADTVPPTRAMAPRHLAVTLATNGPKPAARTAG